MMTRDEKSITKAAGPPRSPERLAGAVRRSEKGGERERERERNMASCSCVLPRADPSFRFPAKSPCSSSSSSSTTPAFSRLQSKPIGGVVLPRSESQTLRASQVKRSSSFDVLMVDPLEAKRLAVKQMQEIQAKQRFKRQRQIEAINGAWAMIGLTAGIVIQGQTGQSILEQLAGYWTTIISFFNR